MQVTLKQMSNLVIFTSMAYSVIILKKKIIACFRNDFVEWLILKIGQPLDELLFLMVWFVFCFAFFASETISVHWKIIKFLLPLHSPVLFDLSYIPINMKKCLTIYSAETRLLENKLWRVIRREKKQ